MGFLDRLLGRPAGDQLTPAPFHPEAVRPQLEELIEALGVLADAMDTESAPLSNPGWRGRLHDLRQSRGSLRVLIRRPDFTKDDLFEVLTCVRPIYRGAPPKDFTHLAHLNDRVIVAIEDVHRSASAAPAS